MNLENPEKNTDVKAATSENLKAATIKQPRTTEVEFLTLPEPFKDQMRIRLEGSGVCASGIPLWEGREWFSYPLSPGEPGHEGWGIVEAVGPEVKNFKVSDRVCFLSQNAYATHDITHEDQAVKLPEEFEDKPFPGEPLACAMNIFNRADIRSGQKVAIVGSGFLGLLLIQLCKSRGAFVVAVSKREFSLKAARENGADEIIRMDDHWQIIDKVRKITNGNFCERVFEATGKEWPLNLSIELTAVRGRLIVPGYHQDGMRQVNMQMLNWRGIDMINAHERDPHEYVRGMKNAIDAVLKKEMNPWSLFTHTFPLEETSLAFRHLTQRPDGFIKALIIP